MGQIKKPWMTATVTHGWAICINIAQLLRHVSQRGVEYTMISGAYPAARDEALAYADEEALTYADEEVLADTDDALRVGKWGAQRALVPHRRGVHAEEQAILHKRAPYPMIVGMAHAFAQRTAVIRILSLHLDSDRGAHRTLSCATSACARRDMRHWLYGPTHRSAPTGAGVEADLRVGPPLGDDAHSI